MKITSIYIAGLGLIGGSFAKKLALLGGYRLSGCDLNKASLSQAGLANEGLEDADLILLCLPPAENIAFLKEKAPMIKVGAIAANCAGVQTEAMEACSFLEAQGIFYLGAHPMAGSEKKGYEASRPNLFEGAPLILCPSPQSLPILKQAEEFFLSLGFSAVHLMDAKEHDKAIALVSQTPHALAALLTNMQSLQSAKLSGGALRDMTRIAEFNAPLWAELFLANQAELLPVLEAFQKSLQEFQSLVHTKDKSGLQKFLEGAAQKRALFFEKNVDKAKKIC